MARTVKKKKELTFEEKLAEALVPVEEQPYQVPENWRWVKLGSLATDMADGPFGSNLKTEHYTTEKEARIIQLSNIGEDGWREDNTKYTTFRHAKEIARSIVNPGDIVIAKMMPAGRAIICPNNEKMYILSSDAVKMVPLKSLNIKYLVYGINSPFFRNQVQGNTQGITRARTSIKKLKDYNFMLPPLPEQQRIVDRIESLFDKLDEAKEKAQAVVDGFEDRKAAILHKAFTGELTGGWRETVGKSLSEWRTVMVGEISDVKGGKRVPKGMSLTDTDTGHPYIKAGNLKQGTVIDNGISYVPDEVLPYIKNYTVNAGDVYITNVGACIGDCGVIPSQFDGANLTENAVKMTNLQCVSEYLAWYLSSSSVQQLIKTLIASATLGKLSIANIKTIPVYLPSNEEQLKIIETISQLLEKEQQAKEAAEQVISQIDTMKKSILARAFRGELGTNDPADESAVELLKRIL